MAVHNITSVAQFEQDVLKAEKPVLVDFWAPWCGPCRMVAPEVEAVAENLADRVIVVKVNIDDLKDLADRYNVMSIPTLIVFKGGNEINKITGFRPKKDIADILEKAL